MRHFPNGAHAPQAPDAHGPAKPPPWGHAALLLVAAACVYAVYLARTDFHVFPPEDTVECIVAAEEINAGHGITTRVISPSVLTFLHRRGKAQRPWPNALRSPLPCLLIAGFARVLSRPMAVALSSGIFFVLSVPLIFLIGHRLSSRAGGLLAAVTYALSPSGLWFGATGLTESSTIFSLAAIVYLMIPSLTWQGCLLAGLAAGVGYLGRSTFTLWAVLIVAYILWRSREAGWGRALGRATLFAAPLLIAIVWWGATMGGMTGQFGYSGQPDIAIREDTGLYPGNSPSLTLESWTPREFIMAHKVVMAKKYGRLAERVWQAIPMMGALPFLLCFFLVELALVLAGGKRAGVRALVYALVLLQALIAPLAPEGHGGVSPVRYLDPLGPIAAVLGAVFLMELLGRYQVSLRRVGLRRREAGGGAARRAESPPQGAAGASHRAESLRREAGGEAGRRAAIPLAGIVLLTALPIVADLAVGPYHERAMAQEREIGQYLSARARPGDIVASTYAAITGWQSGLHSIGLPITPEEFLRMDREMLAVQWIYICHRPGNLPRTEAWKAVMSGDEQLPGFRLVRRFPTGGVLLARRSAEEGAS